jgi:drug/metabolite transporter (DMT)-like permease
MTVTAPLASLARRRAAAFSLLVLANLLWSANWVIGRALREAFDPFALNFWRWSVAVVALAPFALPLLAGKGALIRRHAGLLALLALTGVVLFQSFVYIGLRTTTAINGVLLNSSGPLFILLASWAIDRQGASARQVAGMLVSLAGIVVIITRGEPARLLEFELHAGDAWVLAAMPVWGVYSVALRRMPRELAGVPSLFMMCVAGVAMLAPAFALEALASPPRWPAAAEAAGVLYLGLGASVVAFFCWNRGVSVLGAASAGFTMHLLPAFGTVLAMILLGEKFGAFHAAGIATIVAGVILASTRRA